MQTFFAILASIALASAYSVSSPEASSIPAAPAAPSVSCAKDNKVACCDTVGGGGILGDVLGGSCEIPNLLSISNNCLSGNTFCCPTNSDGQLNIAAACVPISL